MVVITANPVQQLQVSASGLNVLPHVLGHTPPAFKRKGQQAVPNAPVKKPRPSSSSSDSPTPPPSAPSAPSGGLGVLHEALSKLSIELADASATSVQAAAVLQKLACVAAQSSGSQAALSSIFQLRPAIVAALRRFPSDPEVQLAGLNLLSGLAASGDSQQDSSSHLDEQLLTCAQEAAKHSGGDMRVATKISHTAAGAEAVSNEKLLAFARFVLDQRETASELGVDTGAMSASLDFLSSTETVFAKYNAAYPFHWQEVCQGFVAAHEHHKDEGEGDSSKLDDIEMRDKEGKNGTGAETATADASQQQPQQQPEEEAKEQHEEEQEQGAMDGGASAAAASETAKDAALRRRSWQLPAPGSAATPEAPSRSARLSPRELAERRRRWQM
eukprot:g2614.t1